MHKKNQEELDCFVLNGKKFKHIKMFNPTFLHFLLDDDKLLSPALFTLSLYRGSLVGLEKGKFCA